MLFAVCSDRGAPGVSTVARALASARGLPAVVVGADAYGDDMALRVRPDGNHPLPAKPTVLGIGAGTPAERPERTGPRTVADQAPGSRYDDLSREGSHQLSPLVRVVPGFMSAEQGASVAWPVLAATLAAQSGAVFADLGRIHNDSPSMPIAAAADALIPVCRGDQVSVQCMITRLETLVDAIAEHNRRPPVVMPVVVVGKRKHGDSAASAVAKFLGESDVAPTVRGVAWIAWDSDGVAHLDNGGDPWAKPLRNSPLMRSARKAMWHLGVATGLDHAEPDKKPKRTKTKQQTVTGAINAQPYAAQPPMGEAQPAPAPAPPATPQVEAPATPPPPPPQGWTRPPNNTNTNTGAVQPPANGQQAPDATPNRWQVSQVGEETR